MISRQYLAFGIFLHKAARNISKFGLLSVMAVLIVALMFGATAVPADEPAGGPGRYDPEVQALIDAITYTGSSAPIFLQGWIMPDSPLQPTTDVSGPLINLDAFRADPRFAGIDGGGYAVAVLDTGINLGHPFFAGRIVYHYDFTEDIADGSDGHGHGSNVASIVGANDATYGGMADGCDIIALKVFGDGGTGTFADIESALQWVVANAAAYNIVAINMSIGDNGNYNTPQQLYGIDDELAALKAMGVIVISSSGNSFYSFGSAQGVGYPAADPNCYRISAVYDSDAGAFGYGSGAKAFTSGPDRVAPFSQRSVAMETTMAPGAPITGAGATGSDTVTMHGTSQAAPHIAGIAALMQQLAQQELGRLLTPDEFNTLMRDSAVIINDGDDEDDNVTNTGEDFPRVDILALGEAVLDLVDLVETAGYVWGVNARGHIYTRIGITPDNPKGDAWQRVPGVLSEIAVGPMGVWGINHLDRIYYRPSLMADDTPWQVVDGYFIRQISAGPTGAVWGVQKWSGKVYRRIGTTPDNPIGTGWQFIPGSLVHVAVSARGVWGINANNRIYYRDSVGGDAAPWVPVPGVLSRVSVGPSGAVWGINPSGLIYVRMGIAEDNPVGTHWKQVPGRLAELSVGPEVLWGVNSSDFIYFRNSETDDATPWENVPGRLRKISVGGGLVIFLDAEQSEDPENFITPIKFDPSEPAQPADPKPVVVINQSPVADAGGDRAVRAGMLVRLSGEGSFDPDGEIVLYEWDLTDDGMFETLGMKPTLILYSPGSFAVRLRVTDNDGAKDVDSSVIEVK